MRSADAAAALAAAVQQAAENESKIGKGGFGIPARRVDGNPAILHVLPLQHGSVRPDLAPSAMAAIFVASRADPPSVPDNVLAPLFDLTAAEARVLALLVAGKTLSEAAGELGVRTSTAKTHLLRLFEKTDTHRQSDLVRLANSLIRRP